MTTSTRQAAAVFALCVMAYLANGRPIPTDDAIPARYLPVSLLRHHTVTLDPFPWLAADDRPYYLRVVGGHTLSSYPIGAALIATPLYFDVLFRASDPPAGWLERREKLAAAIIVATSAALMFASVRRLAPPRSAAILTAVYAVGSASFSTSSQALWQHGPAQLTIALALYCWTRLRDGGGQARWLTLAGLAMALGCVCRPSLVLIAGPMAVALIAVRPGQTGWLLLGALPPAAFQVWYAQHYFGSPFHLQFALASGATWSTPLAEGLPGILISPSRGLLIYSPVFAGSILGGWMTLVRPSSGPAIEKRDVGMYLAAAVGAVATLLMVAHWNMWWGGACYGPRLLADLSPTLTLLLVPVAPLVAASRIRQGAGLALILWSVGAHAIGAFCGDISWNGRRDVDRHPERLWSWHDNQPMECLRVLSGLEHRP